MAARPLPPGWPLARREPQLSEQMDRPDCDLGRLERTYAQFGVVNGLLSGWRRVYRRELRPLLKRGEPRTLLDIGSGGGDVPRALAGWAAADGLSLEVTASDADPRALAYASRQPPLLGLSFRQGLSHELLVEGLRYDFVTSNHLLHHLTPPELAGLLADSERLTRLKVVHNDIERHPLAYLGFWAGTALVYPGPFARGSFIRGDGLLSVRRSYVAAELRAIAPPGWTVRRQPPFRNLLVYTPPGDSRA